MNQGIGAVAVRNRSHLGWQADSRVCGDRMDVKVLSADERRFTRDIPPVNKYGRPTTYLSYLVADYMFEFRYQSFTPEDIWKTLAANPDDVDMICGQFAELDILREISPEPKTYQYNLGCSNVLLQADLEKFLLEVVLDRLPVASMLDYSPSRRYRNKSV